MMLIINYCIGWKRPTSFLTLSYGPISISDFHQSFPVAFCYVRRVINTAYFPSLLNKIDENRFRLTFSYP